MPEPLHHLASFLGKRLFFKDRCQYLYFCTSKASKLSTTLKTESDSLSVRVRQPESDSLSVRVRQPESDSLSVSTILYTEELRDRPSCLCKRRFKVIVKQ
jgi:hypothetical protein